MPQLFISSTLRSATDAAPTPPGEARCRRANGASSLGRRAPPRTSLSSSTRTSRAGQPSPYRRNYVKHIKADRLVYRGEDGVYMLPACHNCDLFITAMTGGCESRSIADRQRMPWVHNGTAAAGA